MNYIFDSVALTRDPNLAGLVLDGGTTPTGRQLAELLASRAAVLLLIGAVTAAPSRPAVVAVEHLITIQIGDSLPFTDDMKRRTGRLVREIVEHLGGRWVRSGVPVTVRSRYRKGSIYDLGNRGMPAAVEA